jgi:hypothetical protein
MSSLYKRLEAVYTTLTRTSLVRNHDVSHSSQRLFLDTLNAAVPVTGDEKAAYAAIRQMTSGVDDQFIEFLRNNDRPYWALASSASVIARILDIHEIVSLQWQTGTGRYTFANGEDGEQRAYQKKPYPQSRGKPYESHAQTHVPQKKPYVPPGKQKRKPYEPRTLKNDTIPEYNESGDIIELPNVRQGVKVQTFDEIVANNTAARDAETGAKKPAKAKYAPKSKPAATPVVKPTITSVVKPVITPVVKPVITSTAKSTDTQENPDAAPRKTPISQTAKVSVVKRGARPIVAESALMPDIGD